MSDTTTIDKNDKVGSLGDFLSQGNQNDSDYVTTTLNDFNIGNPKPVEDIKPLPYEHATDFVKGVGLSLYQGFEEGSDNLLKFIGRGDTDEAKAIRDKVSVLSQETKSNNTGVNIANGFARGIGNLGPTLPVDIATGAAVQGVASLAESMPIISSVLSKIPSFAIGQGIRNMTESVQDSVKNKEGITETSLRAVASGASTVAIDSAFSFAGTGAKGFFLMPSLSMASATYDAAIQGRLPTREELVKSAGEGFAYFGLFSLMPHLISGSEIPVEKQNLEEYHDQLKESVKSGDFKETKNIVETMKEDGNIRPEIKQSIDEVTKPRYQVLIDEDGKVTYKPIASSVSLPIDTESSKESEKTKESGLSKSVVEDAIKQGLEEEEAKKESLPGYNKRNMDDIFKRASEFINNNYDLALKIAKREAPEQDGLFAEDLYTAIRIKAQAEGDIETLLDLARSDKAAQMATEMGQRIQALDSTDPTNVVKSIREVNKARTNELKKSKIKIKSESKKAVKILDKEIDKINSKPKNWKEFIDSIQC